MKRTVKRLLSITLCAILLLSLLPGGVRAAQTDPGTILAEAYALEPGESLPYEVILTGKITSVDIPYDSYYNNVTVTMQVPGSEDQPIQCYRLAGEGAEELVVGDTITVTGNLTNYKGTIQFMQGCTLDEVVKCGGVPPAPPEDLCQIVDEAYQLEGGQCLPYLATLTGKIVSVDIPYDENYKNITVTIAVAGRENKPIVCYRLKGEGTETLRLGDTVTVTGTLRNYVKTDYDTGEVISSIEFSPANLAQVDEPTEWITLYCRTPASWNECYVYSWDENGYAHNGEWPGTPMTWESENLWSCEIPAAVTEVIFNNGDMDAYENTDALYVPIDERILYVVESDCWMTLDDDNYDNEYANWDLESLAMTGEGIPGVSAWDPTDPAGNMTLMGNDVYEKVLEVPAGTYMTFKFVGNGRWEQKWCFGCATPELVLGQTVNLETVYSPWDMMLSVEESCTLRFTVDLSPLRSGRKATLLVEQIGGPEPVSERDLIVIAPASWTDVYAYTWEPALFGNFPGMELRPAGDPYYTTIPGDMVNLVISGRTKGGSLEVTGDMILETNGQTVVVRILEDLSFRIDYGTGPLPPMGNRVLTVVTPASWTNAHLYTWDPEAYGTYPGAVMQKTNGVYQTTISNSTLDLVLTHVTPNGEYEASQDVRLLNNGMNVTLTVYEDGRCTAQYETYDPDWGPESLALTGEGIPGVGTWDPADPAGDMTEVSDNVFEKILEVPAGTNMTFKVVGNDQWTQEWSFGSQTPDLVLGRKAILETVDNSWDMRLSVPEKCTLRFTVDLTALRIGGKATLLVEETEPPVPTRNLYVIVPASWSSAEIYTWEPETFGPFPGTFMVWQDGAYQVSIPQTMTQLVVSGRQRDGGRYQSGNITLEDNGLDATVFVQSDGRPIVEYGPYPSGIRPRSLALAGDNFPGLREWDPADPNGNMTEVAYNVYEKILDIPAGTSILFKVAGNDSWDDQWNFGGGTVVEGQKITLQNYSSDNLQLTVREDSTLRFTVDLNPLRYGDNPTLLVQKIGVPEPVNTRRLIVFTPDDFWSDIRGYTWDPESFGAWPGAALVKSDNAYEMRVPEDMTKLVLSGVTKDGDRENTNDLYVEPNGRDILIHITKDLDGFSAEVSYGPPLFDRKLTVIAPWDTVDAYTWDPNTLGDFPGTPLESSGDAFETMIPHSVTNLVLSGLVADGIRRQTNDITLEQNGLDVTVTVAADGTYEVRYGTVAEDTRLLTVIAPSTWINPYVYSWEPMAFGEFPGEKMPMVGGVRQTAIGMDVLNLVISSLTWAEKTEVTENIRLEDNGEDVTVIIEQDGKVRIRYGRAGTDVYRVTGDTPWLGNWEPCSNEGLMDPIAPGVYQKCFEGVEPGVFEFKVTKNGTWDQSYGDNGDNFHIVTDRICDITVTLTLLGEEGTVEVDCNPGRPGDVSGDDIVNMADVSRIYAHVRGSNRLTGSAALACADMTGDGRINMSDVSAVYAYVRGTNPVGVVDAAYRLRSGQELPMETRLTGTVISVSQPYDPETGCISVKMVVFGREDRPIICCSLTGADAQKISRYDTVTVSGKLCNDQGYVIFKEGCELLSWQRAEDSEALTAAILAVAYGLEEGREMDHDVTLTGRITTVNTPYSAEYRNITVTITAPGYPERPIRCFRLSGNGTDNLYVGDYITVTGRIMNYMGTVEFKKGCVLESFW